MTKFLIIACLILFSCSPPREQKHFYLIKVIETKAQMGWTPMWDDEDIIFKVGDTVLHHTWNVKSQVQAYPSVIIKVLR